MTPGEYDLALYRGDYHAWEFRLWVDASKTTPIDLTGAEARAQVRDKPKPLGLVVANFVANITDPNVINMWITADAWDDPSNSWPVKKGFWDIEIDWGNGSIFTYLAGRVRITPDITDVDV